MPDNLVQSSCRVEILGGVHTNHGRPLWYTAAYPYVKTNGAEVSIIMRFMQGERTYETHIQDDGEGRAETFASWDFPEIGTGKSVERIVTLYIRLSPTKGMRRVSVRGAIPQRLPVGPIKGVGVERIGLGVAVLR